MRLLFAIPHYFAPEPGGQYGSLREREESRIRTITNTLVALQQLFGRPQCQIDIARKTTVPANQATAIEARVILCTTGDAHLVRQLPLDASYYTHSPVIAEPRLLGYECHAVLRDHLAEPFDYYCYLEDDLVLRDPYFFVKLKWFSKRFREEYLLMPNRYEVSRGHGMHKAYIDGPMNPKAAGAFQNPDIQPEISADIFDNVVHFRRTTNPHAGCFFLTRAQLAKWAQMPYFLDRSSAFVGPLESAATLGVMRTFAIYKPKPENAAFLEIEHQGTAFLRQIRMPANSN